MRGLRFKIKRKSPPYGNMAPECISALTGKSISQADIDRQRRNMKSNWLGDDSPGPGGQAGGRRYPTDTSGTDYGESRTKGTTATVEEIEKAYPLIKQYGYAQSIIDVAKSLQIADPGWLANLIRFETNNSFHPGKYNTVKGVKTCAGLIQFCPGKQRKNSGVAGLMDNHKDTAGHIFYGLDSHKHKDRITAVAKLAALSGTEQMKFVKEFLMRGRPQCGYNKSIDLYMAVFYPDARCKGRGYQFPASVPEVNPNIYTAGDYADKANKGHKLPVRFEGN